MAASTKEAAGEDPEFHRTKIATARFYVEKILPKAHALRETILRGAAGAMDIAIERL